MNHTTILKKHSQVVGVRSALELSKGGKFDIKTVLLRAASFEI